MITKLFFSLLLFSMFLSSTIIYAQENYANETEVNIQQLDKFHEVIFPIWHKAFPDKDYNSLHSYSDKIQKLASDIYKVELPGIFRDKKDQWQVGIKNFKVAVENYTKYSSAKDDEKLLKAAEELHTILRILS